MKPQFVKFDKKRPVYFGWAALSVFEEETGVSLNDIGEALQNMSVKNMIAFVYAGLIGGAKKTKKEIDFSIDDISDWLDEVEDIAAIFNAYIACMPMAAEGKQTGGKAKKA